MLSIGWMGDVYMVAGLLALVLFYGFGKAKGWWDPKAQKAAKRSRRTRRRVQR